MTRYNSPFYFAVPHDMPTVEREQIPQRLARHFGISGPILFVRADRRMRLYKMFHGDKAAA